MNVNKNQEGQIRAIALTTGAVEAEKKWQETLSTTNDAIEARIADLNLMTAAIGKGYEAA